MNKTHILTAVVSALLASVAVYQLKARTKGLVDAD